MHTMKKAILAVVSLAALVVACNAPTPTPVSAPLPTATVAPSHNLDTLELRFDGLSTNLKSQLKSAVAITPQAVTKASGLTYAALSQGTFILDGTRFLSATFKVTPSASLTNVTFIAQVKSGVTINESAIMRLSKFDGSAANPNLALKIKPLHGMELTGIGQNTFRVSNKRADFQAFAEADIAGYIPTDGGYLLPYGFVAKTSTGSRTITPTNPGYVTFAFRMPSSGASDPFGLSVFLEAVTDSNTYITETLEEQNNSGLLLARASNSGAATVNVFPSSSYQASNPTDPTPRVICQVRIAGTRDIPNAQTQLFDLPTAPNFVSTSPVLNTQNVVLQNPLVTLNFPTSVSSAYTQANPVMHSSFQRYDDLTIANPSSTQTTMTPARNYMAGEMLEVSQPFTTTTRLRDCGVRDGGRVFRFQTATAAADGMVSASDEYDFPNASSVALGDLDRDGILDLVVLNETADKVNVRKGNSDGTFQGITSPNSSVGPNPRSLALGDLNNDGKLDVVTANFDVTGNGNSLSVLLGQGNLTFQPAANYLFRSALAKVVLGDFNADGFLDVAGSTPNLYAAAIYLGNGDGTLKNASEIGLAFLAKSAAVGDINNDGKSDIILSGSLSNSRYHEIRLGNGDGTFSLQSLQTNVITHSNEVALGDLNNDGNLDAVIGDTNYNLFLGNGNGTLTNQSNTQISATTNFVIGDVTGDGKADLIFGRQFQSRGFISVLLGQGNGQFEKRLDFPVTTTPNAIAVGDLNGDGRLDMVAADKTNGKVSVRFSTNGLRPGLRPSYSAVAIPVSNSIGLGFLDSNNQASLLFTPTGNWQSSNTSVATVDAVTGTATTTATAGSSNITAYTGSPQTKLLSSSSPLLGALDLSASTDGVSVASTNVNGSFTIEAWVRFPSASTAKNAAILEQRFASGKHPYSLRLNNAGNLVFTRFGVGSGTVLEEITSSNAPFSDTNWHHIAVVRLVSPGVGINPTTATTLMRIDGVFVGDNLDSFNGTDNADNTALLTLGYGNTTGNLNAQIQLDEVRIWNEAKNATYFSTSSNRNNPIATPYPASLLGYFKMDSISNLKITNERSLTTVGDLINMTGQELVSR
jgi:hypothetical protein